MWNSFRVLTDDWGAVFPRAASRPWASIWNRVAVSARGSSTISDLQGVVSILKAVIFDLDGTLIDSTEAIVLCFMHTFDALGVSRPPREEVIRLIGHPLRDQFARLTDHDPDECVRVYRARYEEVCREMTTLMPHARECLERLRGAGFLLGFATSKKLFYSELILNHLGILDFFASRIGPEEVTHPKPHPEAVLKSLEHLGARPEEAFFVGDTFFDVEAARAAGVRCLCVTTGYESRESLLDLKPEGVYDDLCSLTSHIVANA